MSDIEDKIEDGHHEEEIKKKKKKKKQKTQVQKS